MPTIRRTHWRPRPLLVEDCAVVRATHEKFRLPTGALVRHGDVVRLIVTWPTGQRCALKLRVLVTRSAIGRAKRWFTCPHCRRRVGRLYAPSPDQPFACRRCWHLHYASQYRRPSSWDRWLGNLWASLAPRQRRASGRGPARPFADVSPGESPTELTRPRQDTGATASTVPPGAGGPGGDDFGERITS